MGARPSRNHNFVKNDLVNIRMAKFSGDRDVLNNIVYHNAQHISVNRIVYRLDSTPEQFKKYSRLRSVVFWVRRDQAGKHWRNFALCFFTKLENDCKSYHIRKIVKETVILATNITDIQEMFLFNSFFC